MKSSYCPVKYSVKLAPIKNSFFKKPVGSYEKFRGIVAKVKVENHWLYGMKKRIDMKILFMNENMEVTDCFVVNKNSVLSLAGIIHSKIISANNLIDVRSVYNKHTNINTDETVTKYYAKTHVDFLELVDEIMNMPWFLLSVSKFVDKEIGEHFEEAKQKKLFL